MIFCSQFIIVMVGFYSKWGRAECKFHSHFFFSCLCLTRRAEPKEPFPICSNISYCSIWEIEMTCFSDLDKKKSSTPSRERNKVKTRKSYTICKVTPLMHTLQATKNFFSNKERSCTKLTKNKIKYLSRPLKAKKYKNYESILGKHE